MKVRVVPYQPHSLAFGGFEVQMLATMHAVQSLGVDVQPLDFWSRDAGFDVIHVWGMGPMHNPIVNWAARVGVPVVMTALLPYLSGLTGAKRLLRSRIPPKTIDRQTAALLSTLVVLNEESSRTAQRLLGIDPDSIAVVPVVVGDVFFDPPSSAEQVEFGLKDFFLCTGNVCQRKNQLRLARAVASMRGQLLVIGDVLPGEEEYGKELARFLALSAGIKWVRSVAPDSNDLLSAYAQCIAFALPSFDETQPISALEAIAMRKPVLLAERPYAKQKMYEGACLIDPRSVESIAAGLQRIMREPAAYIPPVENLSDCRKVQVGEAYANIYRRVAHFTYPGRKK